MGKTTKHNEYFYIIQFREQLLGKMHVFQSSCCNKLDSGLFAWYTVPFSNNKLAFTVKEYPLLFDMRAARTRLMYEELFAWFITKVNVVCAVKALAALLPTSLLIQEHLVPLLSFVVRNLISDLKSPPTFFIKCSKKKKSGVQRPADTLSITFFALLRKLVR
jgi:hypothetical protein